MKNIMILLRDDDIVGQTEIPAVLGQRYAYHKSVDSFQAYKASRDYNISHIGTGARIPTGDLFRWEAVALVGAFDDSGIDITWQDIAITKSGDLMPDTKKYFALSKVYKTTVSQF